MDLFGLQQAFASTTVAERACSEGHGEISKAPRGQYYYILRVLGYESTTRIRTDESYLASPGVGRTTSRSPGEWLYLT